MHQRTVSAIALAIGALIVAPVHGGVFGSLGNFDVVNDTGHTAHGFEIEIEDSSYDHPGKISSIFGLDRNFGVPSASVERYGAPTVDYITGFGARITYQGSFTHGAWNVGTQSGVFANPRDSCWTLGGVGYPNIPCDHFGIGTFGNPAKTTYSWLLETTPNSATLTKSVVGIPAVVFIPPPPGNPAQPIQVKIHALANPANIGQNFGEAYWVKTYKTQLPHEVELNNLLRHNNDVEAAEVEVEWDVFQARFDGQGINEDKVAQFVLGANDKAVIRRYEFYKYTGLFDPSGDGEVMCDGGGAALGHACDNPFGDGTPAGGGVNDLGNFVGAQIAAFNAVQAPVQVPAPVPEPETYTMLLAGLGLVFGIGRRTKRRFNAA